MNKFVLYEPIYFVARLKSTITSGSKTIPFETFSGNKQLVSGKFIADKAGIYLMSFTIKNAGKGSTLADLYANGIRQCRPTSWFENSRVGSHESSVGCTAVVKLQRGQEVYVHSDNGAWGQSSSNNPRSSFSGVLLKPI